jgi:ribosomal protein L24
MTELSKKFEQFVIKSQKKLIDSGFIQPVKTDNGILVGSVRIENVDNKKNIYNNEKLIYEGIFLNAAAVKIANLVALKHQLHLADEIFKSDQEYGKWYIDSTILRIRYQQSRNKNEDDKADMFWARYVESKDRAMIAMKKTERLALF